MQAKIEASELIRRFQSLITGHSDICRKQTQQLKRVVDNLLPGFRNARGKWIESQRWLADEFNLFEVLGVAGDEVRHSRVLAWLLDHRIERGTHAQGELGFRLFVEEFQAEFPEELASRLVACVKERNYWVRREVSGDEARVDIEIAARGRFLIYIENKIWSEEGPKQTDREWRDLQARRRELRVPEEACFATFLTLDGRNAENPNFHSAGWVRIARVLDRFSAMAEPADVKLFAKHYAKAIRSLCVVEREELEADDAEIQRT